MHSNRIPVRNVYYLLCYAWNQLEQGALIDVSRVQTTSLVDLFASVLCDGLDHIARRGMQQGYQAKEEEVSSIRGRVDLIASARRLLLVHGRALCRFDELSADTLPNRIIKATLRALLKQTEDERLQSRVRVLYRSLREITDIELSTSVFRRVQLSSNERFYRFLMHVCEFVHGCWLVDSESGHSRFRDFIRDEAAMARLFERFAYNFARVEVRSWVVSREEIPWAASSETDSALSLLPKMRTDIVLRRGSDCRIVDAKYYQQTTSRYYDTEKLHSANLYQLLSYVSNAHARERGTVSGMLLYPRVERTLRERYTIRGHEIRISTVDLSAEWRDVRRELLELFV